MNTTVIGNAISMADMLFSGNLVRYPKLKLLYAESQIGWIPFILERADDDWGTTGRGGQGRQPRAAVELLPATSTAASSRTPWASDSIDEIGVDNVMFETDYPHGDTTWPNTENIVGKILERLDADNVYKIAAATPSRCWTSPSTARPSLRRVPPAR